MKKKGFTLVEMLVVIGILLILSAIAVPKYMEVLLRAKVARASADLSVLGNAVEHYRTDYPEYPMSIFANVRGIRFELGIFASLPALTTPVRYINELPKDPFVKGNYQYFSADTNIGKPGFFTTTYGEWVLLSVGPDMDINLNGLTGKIIHYSPTNGSLSEGDIVRSQKDSRADRGNPGEGGS